jgi:hypothetical protein
MSALSRRFILSSAASLPALAVPTIASLAEDDTLTRIDAHRRAVQHLDALAQQQTIDSSPELVAANKVYDDLTWSLIDQPPSTVAGVAALLLYCEEHLAAGHGWPDNRDYYDDGADIDWPHGLIKAMGARLQMLSAQSQSQRS